MEYEPKLPNSEREPSQEAQGERKELSHEELEKLEHDRVASIETSRKLAAREAEAIAGKEKAPTSQADRRSATITATERQASFEHTMHHVRKQLSPASRTFSKVIHTPVVEKTSDFVGKTVARPDPILAGSICAFLAVAGLYAYARYFGFALSGSETLAAFVLGWILGFGIDVIRGLARK